jgi:hypothetical protein
MASFVWQHWFVAATGIIAAAVISTWLLDYIDTSIPDTFINLSNIFNYEGTVFFYSLVYRKYKETELVNRIKSMLPSATINFSLQSNLFDIVPTWHL